jgi:hypothetical protein
MWRAETIKGRVRLWPALVYLAIAFNLFELVMRRKNRIEF